MTERQFLESMATVGVVCDHQRGTCSLCDQMYFMQDVANEMLRAEDSLPGTDVMARFAAEWFSRWEKGCAGKPESYFA